MSFLRAMEIIHRRPSRLLPAVSLLLLIGDFFPRSAATHKVVNHHARARSHDSSSLMAPDAPKYGSSHTNRVAQVSFLSAPQKGVLQPHNFYSTPDSVSRNIQQLNKRREPSPADENVWSMVDMQRQRIPLQLQTFGNPPALQEDFTVDNFLEDFYGVSNEQRILGTGQLNTSVALLETPQSRQEVLESEGYKEFLKSASGNALLMAKYHPELYAIWAEIGKAGEGNPQAQQKMDMFATVLFSSLQKAERLAPDDVGAIAQKLRALLETAREEQNVILKQIATDKACWFLSVTGVEARATPSEKEAIARTRTIGALMKGPQAFAKSVLRLAELAVQEEPLCEAAINEEVEARLKLQSVLQRSALQLRAAIHAEQQKPPSEQEVGEEVLKQLQHMEKDLELLGQRESCSMMELAQSREQAKAIAAFVRDYKQNGHKWWLVQWPRKVSTCMRKPRDLAAVAPSVAADCKKFETAKKPETSDEVSAGLEWIWLVDNTRA